MQQKTPSSSARRSTRVNRGTFASSTGKRRRGGQHISAVSVRLPGDNWYRVFRGVSGATFKIPKWVRVSELTPEEKLKYDDEQTRRQNTGGVVAVPPKKTPPPTDDIPKRGVNILEDDRSDADNTASKREQIIESETSESIQAPEVVPPMKTPPEEVNQSTHDKPTEDLNVMEEDRPDNNYTASKRQKTESEPSESIQALNVVSSMQTPLEESIPSADDKPTEDLNVMETDRPDTDYTASKRQKSESEPSESIQALEVVSSMQTPPEELNQLTHDKPTKELNVMEEDKPDTDNTALKRQQTESEPSESIQAPEVLSSTQTPPEELNELTDDKPTEDLNVLEEVRSYADYTASKRQQTEIEPSESIEAPEVVSSS